MIRIMSILVVVVCTMFWIAEFLIADVSAREDISSTKTKIETMATLLQRPGNPAVAPDGTVYFSMHPFDEPEFKIMRLDNGQATPYPNEQLSKSFEAIIGIHVTSDGTLWWLDMGSKDVSPKLVGWDTKRNALKTVHTIPREVSVPNSFHQDFAIDEKRKRAYIADMSRGNLIDESNPAIVVVDLETGASRRVLSGNKVFQPTNSSIIAEGKPMKMSDRDGHVHDIKLGLNPITIDPDDEWVYFSTMTPGSVYRVPSAVLGDFSKSETEIEDRIDMYADKPSSDWIVAAKDDRVYFTNVDESAISIADQSGTKIWVQDERLIWPDGLSLASDGSVIVTVNQLNRAPVFNNGVSGAQKPYTIMRIANQP